MKAQVPAPQVSRKSPIVAQKKQLPFFPKRKADRIIIGSINDASETEADKLAEIAARSPYEKRNPIKLSASIQKRLSSVLQEEIYLKATDDYNVELFSIIHDALRSSYHSLDLRTKNFMEGQFGTDFSNVKIHDNSIAHKSATALKARAYTYDNHIIFGKRNYQPHTNKGKQLLAHELAHTLQQRNGKKFIQKKAESVVDAPDVAEIFKPIPAIDVIVKKHKEANTGDKNLQTAADKLLLINRNNTTSLWQETEKLAKAAIIPSQEKELDLFFDVYKALKKFGEAKELATTKKYIPKKTAFYSADFYKEVLKDDLNWLLHQEVLKEYFPFRLVDTFHMFLFGPFLLVQSINKIEVLRKKFSEIVSVINTSTGLLDNEQLFVSLKAFLELDKNREVFLQKLTENFSKSKTGIELKLQIASILADKTTLSDFETFLPEEAYFLLKAATPQIQKVASDAYTFWKDMLELQKRISKNEFVGASVTQMFQRNKKYFSEKDIEQPIVRAALSLLQFADGKLPSANQFEKQKTEAAKQFKKILVNASLELTRSKRKTDKENQEVSTLYGVLLAYLESAYSFLLYTVKPDSSKSDLNSGPEDRQILIRIGFSYAIRNIGQLLTSKKLIEIATEVIRPSGRAIFGAPQKETFIGFSESLEWEQQPLSAQQKLQQFLKESGIISESETMSQLMKYFFKNASMKAEIIRLKEELKDIEKTILTQNREDYIPVPNRVYAFLDKMSITDDSIIPRRFILKGAYFSVIESDAHHFSIPVFNNKRFRDESETRFGKKSLQLVPEEVETHFDANGIVVWTISEKSLISFDEEMTTLFPGMSISADPEKEPLDWWNEFLRLLISEESQKKNGSTKPKPVIDIAQVKDSIDKRLKLTEAILFPLQRKALSSHRRILTRLVILPLWKAYKEDVSNISSWENPAKAIETMIYMAGGHPFILSDRQNEELKLQIASTMLEIGPVIYDQLLNQGLFGGAATNRVTLVGRLLPHVVGALSLEKEVAKDRETLLIEYPSEEHTERVAVLVRLKEGLTKVLKDVYDEEKIDFIKIATGGLVEQNYPGQWLEGDSNKGEKGELRDHNSTEPMDTKKPIHDEGKTYKLLKVDANFFYKPAVAIDAGDVKWDKEMLADINPSILLMKENGVVKPMERKDRKGKVLFTYEMVDTDGTHTRTVDVKDTDDELLKSIYTLIYVNSTRENLKTLGEVLETGAEWIKVPLYFVPGLGEAVMAGDLVLGVIDFLRSDEFKLLKSIMMDGEGKKLLEESYNKVASLFSANGLWNALLDENFELPQFQESKPQTKPEDEVNKHSDGRLMKFLHALVRFGKKLLNGISWLKSTINYGLKKIHTFILNHPILAAVISFVTNNYYFIAAAASKTKNILSGDEKIEDALDFSNSISSLLGKLQELQVPLNLVPLDALIDLIVRMVIKVLRGPKGLIAGSVKSILEKAGVYDKILNIISEKLSGTGFDPNKYLNDFINDKIQPIVQKAADFLAGEIGDFLKVSPDLKDIPPPKSPQIQKLQGSDESFEEEPETQAYFESPFHLPVKVSLPAHPTDGKPLDDSRLKELGEQYGQDFSHVRLHIGTEADKATKEAGAEALATGSHIYLSEGLSSNSDPGKTILKHELAHVVQQTGSRPFTEKHTDTPVDGKPGKGIIYDSEKEKAAEAFAQGDSHNNQFTVQPDSQNVGISPALAPVALKFFKQVTKEPEEAKHPLIGPKAPLTTEEKSFAGMLPRKMNDALLSMTTRPNLQEALPAIKAHLQNVISKTTQADFIKLVQEGKVLKKIGKDPADINNWEFKSNHMEIALEEFFSQHGKIMTDIKLNNSGLEFRHIKANNIFLDQLEDKGIWDLLITNTFTGPKAVKMKSQYDPSQFDKYVEATKSIIHETDIKIEFARSEFRLTDHLAKLVEFRVHPDLSKIHTGTHEDPIEIRWTKTGHNNPILLDPDTKSWLGFGYDKLPLDDKPKIAYMNKKTKLEIPPRQKGSFPVISSSDDGPITADVPPEEQGAYTVTKETKDGKEHFFIEIGIKEEFMYYPKKKLQRVKSGKRKMEGKFKTLLKSYSYDWKGYSPDHVQDLGLGGKDFVSNLWPLEGENLNEFIGNKVYKQKVLYKEGEEIKTSTVMELVGKWFIIDSIGNL